MQNSKLIPKLILVYIVFSLLSCSSSPSPILPPLALQSINNKIDLKLLWSQRVGDGVGENYLKFQPAVYKNSIIYLDYEGTLLSINQKTGDINWQKKYNITVSSQFEIIGNKIIFGSSTGELLLVNLDSGQIIWTKQFSSEILSKPAIFKNYLVFNSVDGFLYAFDINSGKQIWVYNRTVPILTLRGSSNPIISNGVVLSGFDNGKLIALKLDDGSVLWDTTVAISSGSTEIERIIDINIIPVIKDDLVYIATYQGRIAAIEITSGKVVWSRDLSVFNDIVVDDTRLYVVASDSRIWALDRSNGATLWKQDALLRRNLSGPVVFHEQIVVGDFNGYLHWISRENGKILSRIRLGEYIQNDNPADDPNDYFAMNISKVKNILSVPIVLNDVMYAVNRYGDLHAYIVKKNSLLSKQY